MDACLHHLGTGALSARSAACPAGRGARALNSRPRSHALPSRSFKCRAEFKSGSKADASIDAGAMRDLLFPKGSKKHMDVSSLTSGDIPKPVVDKEITVGQAMSTDVASLKPEMDVREAMKILLSWGVSGGPVVNEQGAIVGVLSETDLLWKEAGLPEDEYIIPPVTIPFIDATFSIKKKSSKDEVLKVLAGTVKEAMTTKITTATPDMLLKDAAKVLLKMKVNRLPVVDENNVLVGIITRSDIIKYLADEGCNFMLDGTNN